MSYIQTSKRIAALSVGRSVRNAHSPLRICHLSKYYPPQPGGIETHVRALATSQAALGAQVDVLCVNACDESGNESHQTHTIEELDLNVRVIRFGRILNAARVDIFTNFSQYFGGRGTSYDIVHLHTPNPGMGLHWSLAHSSVPLIVTHHSDIVKQRVLKHMINPVLNHIYHYASRVLISSPTYLAGSEFLRPYHDRVQVLPFGIDLSIYRQPSPTAIAYEKQFRSIYSGPIWLCVGRLVYYKALHVAISALRTVPGTLVVIGKGELAGSLRQHALDLGVSDRVVFKPYASQDELVGAYRAATALWFPSNARSEAFGVVQVEAMASGCPVINAAIPNSGVTWVSRGGIEGLTIPMNDAWALSDAANRLLREPQLRGKLSIASRARSLQFDQEVMARESLHIYEQAIDNAKCYPL
ncbi:MAG: glycosyltransferase [Leptolyngbya sp. Prado105]|jgi:rhamnosyl/mannosyltransferase|nr:glycosyltransferase [Leptolyngbya sp. Prado105]